MDRIIIGLDRIVTKEFIEVYRENPCLWYVKSPDYSNKHKRNEAYKLLLNILKARCPKSNSNIDSVKKKIGNLRNGFRRELRKIGAARQSGCEHFTNLWYFDDLAFLIDDELSTGISFNWEKIEGSFCQTDHISPSVADLSRAIPDQKIDPSLIVGAMGGSEAGSTQDSVGESAIDERPMPLSPEQFLTEEEEQSGMHQEPSVSSKRPESYKLRHNNHLSLVFESLAGDESFMDVTLTAQGKSIKAHKSVLSAVSPYFNGVLRANPCQHPIIIMPRDIQFEEISNIIRYIYRGEMTVPADDLSSLLKTAEILQVSGLSPSDGNMGGFIASNLFDQNQSPSTSANPTTSSIPTFSTMNQNQGQYSQYQQNKKNAQKTNRMDSSIINPSDFVNADLSCVKEELPSDDEGMDEMITTEGSLDPLSLSSRNSPHHSATCGPTRTSNEDLSRTSIGTTSINISPHLSSDGLQKMKIPPSTGDSLSTPPLGTPPLATPPLGTPPSETSSLSSIQPWQCPHCDNAFIRGFENLSSHLRLKHQSKPAFLCECGRVFIKQNDKIEHKKSCPES